MARDLAARVERRHGRTRAGTEEEAEARRAAQRTLADQIENKLAVFQSAMPRGVEARLLVRDAISQVRTQPDLASCELNSVLGGLMTFAQLGLRPGVMGQGWLIPFRDWKTKIWRAQIIIGYKGYLELIHRARVGTVPVARTVHERDEFDVDYGLNDRLVHKPFRHGDRGEVTDFYSVIKFGGGGHVFWHMTLHEMQEWRDRFAMARKPIWQDGKKVGEEIVGPWRDHFNAMGSKTVFLRAQNWAPKTIEVQRAEAADGGVRTDLSPDPDELFFIDKPEPHDPNVIDQVDDDTPPQQRRSITVSGPPATTKDTPPARQPPPAPPPAENASQPNEAQHKAMAAILRTGGVTDRDARLRVLSALVGRTIDTAKQLTEADARNVLSQLGRWQDAGTLAGELAALAGGPPAAAPPAEAPAGELPDPETNPEAWHHARHPRRQRDGTVITVDIDEWCELCPAAGTT